MGENIENKGLNQHLTDCLRASNLRQKRHNGAVRVPVGTVGCRAKNAQLAKEKVFTDFAAFAFFARPIFICSPA
jgi:hypothetical protein